MEVFKLTKPIMVNGEEVKELPYDFENMSAKAKIDVGKEMKAAGVPMSVAEIDSDYHFYLFAKAVSKANAAITTADVMRMSAKDADRAAALARNFFYLNSEE